jgi:MFS family permease
MTEPDKKRRLPILQDKPPADEAEAEPRPPWHWSGIGVVITFLVWLPVAAGITALTARMTQNSVTPGLGLGILIVGMHLLGFLVATFVGGFFIGKFGGEAGPKEGAVSGVVTAAFAVALAAAAPTAGATIVTWAVLLMIVGGSGSASSMMGAKIGKRGRTS